VISRDYHAWDRDHLSIDTSHKRIDECVAAALTALTALAVGLSGGRVGAERRRERYR
jgi:hypothetical protein